MDVAVAVAARTRMSMDTVMPDSPGHAMTPATLVGTQWTARSCAVYAEKIPIVQTAFFELFINLLI